jgi:hypothetical protein
MKKLYRLYLLFAGSLLFSHPFAMAQNPTVTVLAGSAGFLDSTLALAQFRGPHHIIFNPKKGEYYVADRFNLRIRAIKNGQVRTLCGSSTSGSQDGVGSLARLTGPTALALNATGDTLFFADAAGNRDGRIRMLVLTGADSGKVLTIAGAFGGNPSPSNNAVGTQARLGGNIFTLERIGNFLYSNDFNSGSRALRRIQLSGTFPVTSLDSSGNFTLSNSANYVIGECEGMTKGISDTVLYVSSRVRNQILKVNLATGNVSVFAGTGTSGLSNLTALTSNFGNLAGLAFDSAGNRLFVAEKGGNGVNVGVRVIYLTGDSVRLIAGGNNQNSFVDAAGSAARFNNPQGLSWDTDGQLFVGDVANNRIRKINLSGNMVSTFAGFPSNDIIQPNPFAVRFSAPQSAIVDAVNNVWFADRGNHVIRKYNAQTKVVSIVAGKRGVSGSSNGPALDSALFNLPYSMALKGDSLFISDGAGNNNGIRILNLSTNRVSTFSNLRGGLMVYKNFLLVFGDVDGGASFQNRIIRFNLSTGVRDTIAGTGQNGFSQGPGLQAQIFNPQRGAVLNDTLYFVSGRSSKPWRIRRLALNSPTFNVDTLFTRAQTDVLNGPGQLVLDQFGTMYIANNPFNGGIFRANLLTKIILPNIPASILPQNITGIAFDTNRNALILSEASNSRLLRVSPIYSVANVAPSFSLAKTRDTLFRTDNALKTWEGTAINISANQTIFNTVQNQTVSFQVSIPANQQALFSQTPSLSATGVLTYKLVDNVPFSNINNISVPLSIRARDNGGVADGGVDSSAAQTFTIVIRYQNLAPVFTITDDTIDILPTSTSVQTINNYLINLAAAPVSEASQSWTFRLTSDNDALFSTLPSLTGNSNATSRGLTFRINGTLGLANVRIVMKDNGGNANGGVDSTVKNFVIRVTTIISIEENVLKTASFLFPNPTKESLSLKGMEISLPYQIVDYQGKTIQNGLLHQNGQVDVSSLKTGMYLFRFRDEKGIPKSLRFVKD